MSTTTTKTVVYLGASRGIGFAAYTRLAQHDKTVRSVLLLRNVSSFEASAEYKTIDPDVLARTVLVQGNAHSEQDVHGLIADAAKDGSLDAVVFSIGT